MRRPGRSPVRSSTAGRRSVRCAGDMRPRVLFVGSSEFDLPLAPGLAKKWDAVSQQVDVRVIGRAHTVRSADPRFRLIAQAPAPLRSPVYYARLPAVVADELRRFRPQVVITK